MSQREIIMECARFGSIVRVTAVDTATATEVTFQAPATTPQSHLQKLASNKLKYVMAKKK